MGDIGAKDVQKKQANHFFLWRHRIFPPKTKDLRETQKQISRKIEDHTGQKRGALFLEEASGAEKKNMLQKLFCVAMPILGLQSAVSDVGIHFLSPYKKFCFVFYFQTKCRWQTLARDQVCKPGQWYKETGKHKGISGVAEADET